MAALQPVTGRTSAADNNSAWLQLQLDQERAFTIPPGTLYVRGTATTPIEVGCGRVKCNGSGGYSTVPTPALGQITSRIVQLGQGPIFRLRGAGFCALEPLELVGDRNSAAIEIEGRAAPATGRHRFANLVFRDWNTAFRALNGYFDANGNFVKDENHADNCSVTNCETTNCERVFHSLNEQAVMWSFNNLVINWDGGVPKSMVVFDIERGGKVVCNILECCTNLVTIFRVRDYSPNNAWLTCRSISFDRMISPDTYLRVFEYVGEPSWGSWTKWDLEVDGFSSMYLGDMQRTLYKVPSGMNMERFKVNIRTWHTK